MLSGKNIVWQKSIGGFTGDIVSIKFSLKDGTKLALVNNAKPISVIVLSSNDGTLITSY